MFASEAVARTWSIQFPWLDRPDFYRSGPPTRTLAAYFAGTIQNLCECKIIVDALRKSVFEKTMGVYQATSVTDAQRRVQNLVESSLSALRVNVQSALNTNAKIIASWKELVDRFGSAVK